MALLNGKPALSIKIITFTGEFLLNRVCAFRWDTRNLNEPTDSMIIDLVKAPTDTQSIDNAIGISALEYEPTIPTR